MDFSQGIQILEQPRNIIWKSSYQDKKSRHGELIREHPFNHSMQLFLPYTTKQQKQNLERILSGVGAKTNNNNNTPDYFYHVLRINHKNVEPFLDMITNAIASNHHIRCLATKGPQDPIKISIANRHFVMHVDEKMRYRFGMDCRKIESFFDRDVWCVDVDLSQVREMQRRGAAADSNSDTLTQQQQPGHITRLKWAMKRWLEEEHFQIDFVLSIENQHQEATDFSLFTQHQFPSKKISGYGEHLQIPLPKKFYLPKIREVVSRYGTESEKHHWEHTIQCIMNYIGIVSSGCHHYLKTTNHNNEHEDPFFVHNLYGAFREDEYTQPRGALFFNLSGFVSPSAVTKTLDALRTHYSQEELRKHHTDLWYSILVTGFESSPISWRQCNHGTCIGSENDYLFVNLVGEDETYLSIQCLSEYDSECQG